VRDRTKLDDTRPFGLASDQFVVEQSFGAPVVRVSYDLWRRLCGSLVDGWLNWTGTPRHLDETQAWISRQAKRPDAPGLPAQTGISLAARHAVDIDGGFVGGVRAASYRLRAYRAKD
jgi:hypothetical protein